VIQVTTGSTDADTAARKEAAFATWCDYVETRNGGMFNVMAPPVRDRFTEYTREESKTHPSLPRSVSREASVYFDSLPFREQTLTKFVSQAAFNYYAATSSSVRELRESDARRAQQAAEDRETAEWEQRTQHDLSIATKEHTTLLGVPMGVRLTLPTCASIGVNPREAAGAQLLTGVGLGALTEPVASPDKPVACLYDAGGVSIQWLQTPDWVTVSQGTVMGHVLLGGKLTVRETDDLVAQLARKFGRATSVEKLEFQNMYGAKTVRNAAEWVIPGIYVKYTPLPGNMQMPVGELRVELETLHRMRVKQEAENAAKEPHL
jgi:hypothetical protein